MQRNEAVTATDTERAFVSHLKINTDVSTYDGNSEDDSTIYMSTIFQKRKSRRMEQVNRT